MWKCFVFVTSLISLSVISEQLICKAVSVKGLSVHVMQPDLFFFPQSTSCGSAIAVANVERLKHRAVISLADLKEASRIFLTEAELLLACTPYGLY